MMHVNSRLLCWLSICIVIATTACEPAQEACVYDGVTHQPGENFASSDACSTCHCTTGGRYECTVTSCALDAGVVDVTLNDAAAHDIEGQDTSSPSDTSPRPDATSDAATQSDTFGRDSAWGVDVGNNPTCSNLLVQRVSTATVLADLSSAQPAVGDPFVYNPSGIEITRMTDGSDSNNFASGYTNGYSRWSPASFSGIYLTAFASNGAASVYRVSDRSVVRTLSIGEPNELNWDSSGADNTESHIYYRSGAALRRLDVESGDDILVHNFSVDFPGAGAAINGVEGAPSRDMRYWALQICDSMSSGGQCVGFRDVIVYDKVNDVVSSRISAQYPNAPTPNFVDMSPSGSRIVVGSCAGDPVPFNGMYAWSRDFSSIVRLSTGCTHSGWAYGRNGEEYFVSQDPCGANNNEVTFSCDYITAVDVNDASGWEHRVPVLGLGDLGWGNGIHLGRIYDERLRGWFFLSTYSDSTSNWGRNQLMFVELVAHDQDPRLWRISPTLNNYHDYWSEAFASLDFQARYAYWGANWMGQEQLQLYRARLCADWSETLNGL